MRSTSRQGYSNLRQAGGGATVMSFLYNSVGNYQLSLNGLKAQVHSCTDDCRQQIFTSWIWTPNSSEHSVLLISGANLSLELKEWKVRAVTDSLLPLSVALLPHSVASVRHAAVDSGRPTQTSRSGLHLLLLHEPPVVGQDFTLRQIERHLQGHQDGELKWDQLPPADPETLLQLLQRGQRPEKHKPSTGSTKHIRVWLTVKVWLFQHDVSR